MTRHTVAAVAYDRVANFELAVPGEVFGVDEPDLPGWYRFIVCAVDPPPVRTSAGFSIETPYGLADLLTADTIVVPGWDADRVPDPELLDALQSAHRRGARIMSVCTGAFLLAAAGLLDGRRATTHWAWAAELAARHPTVRVDPRVLYVDEGSVLTSAGTAAGIDLCLHVVRCDFGAEVANTKARRMVVPPHRDGGQAQYIDLPVATECCDDGLSSTMAWMLDNIGEPLSVRDFARHAGWSTRTFARRFTEITGTTPHHWLQSQRILLAQRLLETTDEPIERVAERAGFGTPTNLRKHFAHAVGTSPNAYRRTFQAAGGALPAGAA